MTRYFVALGAFAAAALFRYAATSWLGDQSPYLQFFPAIIVAAWFGGFGPGLFGTLLSSFTAMQFLLPPDGPAVGARGDQISLVLFTATGVFIAWLSERLHRTERAERSAAASATARAERLDAILDTTIDGIVVIDAAGRIESFNRGAERLFGYTEAEVLGRNVSMLMPSPHHEQHDEYLRRYLETGEARIIGIGREVTARRRDGSLFPVRLSVGEMRIGAERKFTGMLHDLSRRAQLEGQLGASEARWRAIVDSAVDGIVVIDRHGRIEAFNRAAERLFGYTTEEVLWQNVNMLMPSPYHEEHDGYLARYLSTGHAKIIGIGREVQGRRKDGTTFPVHLSVGQMTIDGEQKFTGILHDLSTRVQMETRLREQAALAKLGEMAAVIAHEVKNPLAGIRGAIQILGNRIAKEGGNAAIAQEIITRIDSLDRMMKDLLMFARTPQPKVVPTDLAPLVSAIVSLLSQDPAMKEVEIAVEGGGPQVVADPDMLRIVFQNLLINSAQAMKGKGRIQIAIEAGDQTCQLTFADDGPGIPAETREKIFTPFFTTKARGSGLGLPTAKRLIEAHQGQITIECPPEGGTWVRIRLPLGTTPRTTADVT